MIKRILPLFLVLIFLFSGCMNKKDKMSVNRQEDYTLPSYESNQIDLLLNSHLSSVFTQDVVTLAQVENLIKAATKSPSISGNDTPWHFTAIMKEDIMKQITGIATKGCVVIVVSAPTLNIVDAGVATQSICIAAQSMGLGVNIDTTNIKAINTELVKQSLAIPDGYDAVSVVCVGYEDTNNLTSTNNEIDINDYVNYIE